MGPVSLITVEYTHPLPNTCIAYAGVEKGGGATWALGCYTIAIAQALVGPLTPVSATATTYPPSGCDVSMAGVLKGAGGEEVRVLVGIAGPKRQGLRIVGEKGIIDVRTPFRPTTDGSASFTVTDKEGGVRVVSVAPAPAFAAEVAAFEDAVTYRSSPSARLADTASATAVLQALLALAGVTPRA